MLAMMMVIGLAVEGLVNTPATAAWVEGDGAVCLADGADFVPMLERDDAVVGPPTSAAEIVSENAEAETAETSSCCSHLGVCYRVSGGCPSGSTQVSCPCPPMN